MGDGGEGARRLSRRAFVGGGLGLAALAAMGCRPATWRQGSNVIVIVLDDMRADLLQFMPKTRALFPRHFTEARANGGACVDTRLGLFTGTTIRHHPWDWWRTATDHDPMRTWGPWLQARGYRTGLFGKYINADVWTTGAPMGWDTWRAYYAQAHHEHGFSIDDGTQVVTPAVGNLEYLTDELIAFATASQAPFFASWNPQHPHTVTETGELTPLPEHAEDFPDLVWPVPLDEDVTGKPAWVQALAPLTEDDALDIQRAALGQARVLAGVDDAIERLFAALDAAGTLQDTYLFFTSDQGVHYGEHRWGSALGVPAAVQKQTLYDPVVRIPLLAHGPDLTRGLTDVPVTQSDITATVMAIAQGLPSHALDGIDLREVAWSGTSMADRTLLLQARTWFTPSPDYDAVVTGPRHPTLPLRKLARLETGERELYQLGTDPGELVNLADDPARADERGTLEAMLDGLLA